MIYSDLNLVTDVNEMYTFLKGGISQDLEGMCLPFICRAMELSKRVCRSKHTTVRLDESSTSLHML